MNASGGFNMLHLGVGLVALLGGLATLAITLRRNRREQPKQVAMLIAGMMATAFGLYITAFAIAWSTGDTPNLNAEAVQ